MPEPNLLILESDHSQFCEVLEQLRTGSNAKLVFLIDKAGRQIASQGSLDNIDPTSLASLTAGNVAATEGVAQVVGEPEFTTLFHEGTQDNLFMSVVCDRIILLVVFDQRSSLGLVRLRVSEAIPGLAAVMQQVQERVTAGAPIASSNSFGEISEDDIDALFG